MHGGDAAVDAQSVRDEPRHIFRNDNSLAQRTLGKLPNRANHSGISFWRGNDLQQVHVTRRIEKVRAQKPATEFFGAAFE